MVSYPSSSESSFDAPGTPKATLRAKAVYVPPIDTVNSDLGGGESGDSFMSGNARGGSDQRAGSSSGRRRHSQQRRPPASYPEASPAAPQGFHAPVYAAAYPPPYPAQYMMPPPPHTPTYTYPPAFHVPEQPHPSYPTLATYPQYSPDPAAAPSFRYPSPTYAQYSPQPASFSPGALYSHQHPQQHVYPGSAYPYHQHQHQHQHPHPHSPGGAQEGDGTWWYVPPPLPSPHTSHASPYFYPHPAPPQHAPPHPCDGDASPTHASTSSPSHSSGVSGPASLGRPIVRRSYHPNPPAHRSEWVMWVGNVPSDAGHDEMWRFFSQPPDGDGGGGGGDGGTSSSAGAGDGVDSVLEGSSGVLSIFLISRSSCAFVNYETDAHLQAAISRFNGVPLRPDPRCARLVCRVRRKDDDLRAGVGAQRGMGMHMRWVKANSKAQRRADSASPPSVSDPGTPSSSSAHSLPPSVSALSFGSSDDEGHPPRPPPRPQAGSNSSDSLASTNSSFLRLHFPQRFFILKSLTRDDLDLSVQTGLWATQRHNEGILDRAFRTSKDIFLIFSVNKSGEFYGYARMSGPIVCGESSGESSRVPWARRDDASSPVTGRGAHAANPDGDDAPPAPPAATPAHSGARLFSPTHYVGTSPQPMSSAAAATPGRAATSHSAPAVLGKPHRNISGGPTAVKFSLDYLQRAALQLDEDAPFRMRRDAAGEGEGEGEGEVPPGPVPGPMLVHSVSGPALHSVPEEPGAGAAAREEGWGQDFKLTWICTERLPFVRTRHIRNPWNHDREVKVSRDGTELEPSVGQALLDEWRAYLEEEEQPPPQPPPASASAREAGAGSPRSFAPSPRPPRPPARGPGGPPRS